jgi:hypothetical protein
MLFDFKTENWTELANIGIGWPEWSHDGDYIWFVGATTGGRQGGIFRVRVSDRKLEQMVSLKDFRQAPGWRLGRSRPGRFSAPPSRRRHSGYLRS